MSVFDAARSLAHALRRRSRLLLPQRAQVFLHTYAKIRRAERGEDVVVPIDLPKGHRVLVLAPHPDDEVIGCGGTLHKHCLAGHEVVCVYLTSGEATCAGGSSTKGTSGIGEMRELEARKGAEAIGFSRLDFLRQKDGDLQPTDNVVQRIAQHVANLRPDVVYLPFFLERHPDHLATNRILMSAYLQASPKIEFRCCAYETVDPIPRPNCVVDISESVSTKTLALEQHETARKAMNIIDPTLGLNMHRALHISGGKGYAEAFVHTTADEYFRLLQAVSSEIQQPDLHPTSEIPPP